ncbi:MAG: phenylalanine--tRNA ligase subunit beta [Gammaproteobacteria bacterium]|nr:phenylalanine--tRNA ligase subunit beta [Gammaproteobacteria bacterium]
MKFSEQWLREFVSPPGDTAALVHQLTMQGLEVEGTEPAGPLLDKVVVARVLGVTPHPGADRLRVCRVDVGGAEAQIVCGAPNVRTGGVYAVALPGARLPGDLDIRPTRLRGVESAGMLCSGAELGMADRSDGLLELEEGIAPGTPVSSALDLADQVIDVKVTANRADCFSVTGIARDLAAALDLPFLEPQVVAVPPASQSVVPVLIENPVDCPRFGLRVIRDVDPAAVSPFWLRERLRRSGIRAIHPVVDVTNYVMLELGQPMHAYDLDRVADGLVVRRARPGEQLELLTGDCLTLDDGALVIAGPGAAVGLAGIMGGAGTGVTASTRHILLEAAFFTPGVIAGRARRFGLQTDAATRFERGVDPGGQERALERATALLLGIAGGKPGPCQVSGRPAVGPPPLILRRARLSRVLGQTVADAEVEAILRRLGMEVTAERDGWRVSPPSFRFDIGAEIDLVEEVARIYGYERIASTPGLHATRLGHVPASRIPVDRARTMLVDRGYQEAITYSFIDGDLDRQFAGGRAGVALLNPLSAELGVMRQTLWAGLLQSVRHNLARQQRRVRLFEYGVRFLPAAGGLTEESLLAGVAQGSTLPEQWDGNGAPADFFDVKSDVEAVLALVAPTQEWQFVAGEHPALQPGRTARILRGGNAVGWIGVLHPRLVAVFDLPGPPVLFELAGQVLQGARQPVYEGMSRFPVVRRDIAVLVSRETPVAALQAAIAEAAGTVLREVVVFDIFAGERIDPGQKSVALGLILQETSRTLTDADADRIIGCVVQRLALDFGAKIRE